MTLCIAMAYRSSLDTYYVDVVGVYGTREEAIAACHRHSIGERYVSYHQRGQVTSDDDQAEDTSLAWLYMPKYGVLPPREPVWQWYWEPSPMEWYWVREYDVREESV